MEVICSNALLWSSDHAYLSRLIGTRLEPVKLAYLAYKCGRYHFQGFPHNGHFIFGPQITVRRILIRM